MMNLSLGQHQIMIDPLNGTRQRPPVISHPILGMILLMGPENSKSPGESAFSSQRSSLFRRPVSTFLRYINIFNQITPSGLAL